MTVDEIFSALSAHMATGVEMHNNIADAFYFLNLKGYAKEQERHYFEESNNYRCLHCYYLTHFNRLIAEKVDEKVQIIPSNWIKYSRADVDINTRKNAIRDLMKKWVEWEKDTKKLFETCYKELNELNESAAAHEIQHYIIDVDDELRFAQEKLMSLEAMGYDMAQIIAEQYEDEEE